MAFNGSGTYVLPVTTVSPATGATTIDADAQNTLTADLETALSLCITSDGQSSISQNLKMSTKRHTGVGNGVADTDYAAFGQVKGKQTIFIPASAMKPTISGGCASLVSVETQANRPDMQVLDFDNGVDEHAQFQIAFPKSWNLGTITFQVFWTTTNTGTEGVAWGLQGVSVSDDATIDVLYGAAIVVTDDNISAAEDMLVTGESAAVTIADTPIDDDTCFFRFFRDISDGNDDMTEDARLIGIKLFFTTDAGNDA